MFRAIFTNSFGILFSRITGFIRDLLSASHLGANIYSDIFFIAFKLPNLFRRIFAEGALSQTFIPSFTRSTHKAVFAAHIFSIFLLIILVLSLLVTLFSQEATKLIAIGFDQATIQTAAPFVAINFWYLPLIFSVTFIAALLQYKHHFATTAFATSLLNLSLIVALLLSADSTKIEIVYYISYAVVIGGMLQLAVHLIALKRLGLCPLVIGGFKYHKAKAKTIVKDTKKFKKEFFPAIWGNSTAQLSAFLDTWLASFLASGFISYLYYANRIFQLPLALFAIATSIAIFPKISRYLKNNDLEKAHTYMYKAFWFLGYLLTFSTLGGVILADEIVWLLFERGAFSHKDTIESAAILQMYMLGLLPFGLGKLFLMWLYAQQRQKIAAKIATYSLSVNIIFSLLFITPFGAAGLALASSLSGFITLWMSITAFGKKHLKEYIFTKHSLFLIGGSVVFVIILLLFKQFVDSYI
jgi:putative peptidoglycan lipid II flippase